MSSPKQQIQQLIQNIYKDHLNDHSKEQPPTDLYQQFLSVVEPALFTAVLDFTQGNISKAAQVLGINRATLKKKLQKSQN